jgi:hypothetical protein
MSKIGVMDLSVVDTLILAKALVEEGWCQGHLRKRYPGKVRHCALGAVMYSSNENTVLYSRVTMELGNSIGIKYKEWNTMASAIVQWNDSIFRRKKQVVRAFDKAIELASKEAMESVNV